MNTAFFVQIFIFVFAIDFVVTLVYLFQARRLLEYVKKNHPAKWEKLGKPTLFWNNSPQNTLHVVGFILSHEDQNDPSLKSMLKKTRILFFITIGLFMILVPIFFLMAFTLDTSS